MCKPAPVQSVFFVIRNSSTDDASLSSSSSASRRFHISPSSPLFSDHRPPPPPRSQPSYRHFDETHPHHSESNFSGRPSIDLTFEAGQPSALRCVAVGGYPPPEIAVRIEPTGTGNGDDEWADMTDRLATVGHSTSLIGQPGLRVMLYRTERSTESLVFDAEDDGKTLTCVATVADIGSVSVSARLLINREFMSFPFFKPKLVRSLGLSSVCRPPRYALWPNSAR